MKINFILAKYCVLILLISCAAVSAKNSKTDCEYIREITEMPFNDTDEVNDKNYYKAISQGKLLNNCYVNKVTDMSLIPDPRKSPKFNGYTVGDIAYSLFIKVNKISFTYLLPQEVQSAYKEEGVYAYFKFMEKIENRKKLQKEMQKLIN